MFDRYYCIKTFCDAKKLDHFKENVLEISYIRRLNFREKGTFTACVLITPLQGLDNVTFDVTDLGSLLCTFLSPTSDFRTALEREFPC